LEIIVGSINGTYLTHVS